MIDDMSVDEMIAVKRGVVSNQRVGTAAIERTQVTRLSAEPEQSVSHAEFADDLAVEAPLEIRLRWGVRGERQERAISVTMRTPGHDDELAAGFLLTEGVVRDSGDIDRVEVPGDGTATVELAPGVEVRLGSLERNFYTTSSCGICGKASLAALRTVMPPRRSNDFTLPAGVLWSLPDRLARGTTCLLQDWWTSRRGPRRRGWERRLRSRGRGPAQCRR